MNDEPPPVVHRAWTVTIEVDGRDRGSYRERCRSPRMAAERAMRRLEREDDPAEEVYALTVRVERRLHPSAGTPAGGDDR